MTQAEEMKDKRGRKWEMFLDPCYYDMVCVRCIEDKSFDSNLSFHFSTKEKAAMFFILLRAAN